MKNIFCIHKDELIDKQVLPSAYEISDKTRIEGGAVDWLNYVQSAVVYVLKCSKCGRVKIKKVKKI